jgi:hypothetical protein
VCLHLHTVRSSSCFPKTCLPVTSYLVLASILKQTMHQHRCSFWTVTHLPGMHQLFASMCTNTLVRSTIHNINYGSICYTSRLQWKHPLAIKGKHMSHVANLAAEWDEHTFKHSSCAGNES